VVIEQWPCRGFTQGERQGRFEVGDRDIDIPVITLEAINQYRCYEDYSRDVWGLGVTVDFDRCWRERSAR
jgi:hypothetical protein